MERQALELRDVARMLLRHKLLVTFILASFLGAAVVYTTTAPERYLSSTRLLLLPVVPGSSLRSLGGGASPAGPLGLDMDPSTQAQVLDSSLVATRVAKALRLDAEPDELAAMVDVRSGETQVLQIDAVAGSGKLAAAVANGFARQYIAYRRELTAATLETLSRDATARKARLDRQLKEVEAEITALRGQLPPTYETGVDAPETAEMRRLDELTTRREDLAEQRTALRQRAGELRSSARSVGEGGGQIIQRAVPGTAPVRPKAARDIPVGLLAGLLVALVAVFVREYFDDRVRGPAEVEQRTGARVLAVVPRQGLLRRSRSGRPLARRREHGGSAAAFRRLRARLLAGGVATAPGAVLVTSVEDDEASAVTVARLAEAFARANFRTLLLTLDVRHHRVEKLLEVRPAVGLTDVLMDHRPFASVVVPTGLANLLLVPAGSGRPEDSDLFASTRFGQLLREAVQLADVVFVDAPPESTGGDLAVVAGQADAALLLARAGATRYRSLRATLAELHAAGTTPLGVVLADRTASRGGHHAQGRTPPPTPPPGPGGRPHPTDEVRLGARHASIDGVR